MQHLQVADAVEDDIQAAWNDTSILHHSMHRVSLGWSSNKEKAISAI